MQCNNIQHALLHTSNQPIEPHNKQQAQTGRTHDTLGSVLAAETVVQYSLSHTSNQPTAVVLQCIMTLHIDTVPSSKHQTQVLLILAPSTNHM
jgi:hypothetical protein